MKTKIIQRLFFFLLASFFIFPHIVNAKGRTKETEVFQITNNGMQQNGPLIDNNKVVWTDWRGTEGVDIWIYDLKTKIESPLIVKPAHQRAYGFSENKVIYWDESTTPGSIKVFNIKNSKEIEIARGENLTGANIYQNLVVYVDGRDGGNLYLVKLNNNQKIFISDKVYNPKIWGNNIIWTVVSGGGYYNIKGYNIITKKFFDISSKNNGYQSAPNIFRFSVAWVDSTPGSYAIYIKNLLSGKEEVVYQSNTSGLASPCISEKYIAWVVDRGVGAHDIFVQNRITKEIIELSNFGPQQPSPTVPNIDNKTVVWMSWHTGNGDIYGALLGK